jgi:hypothetical protein
MGPRACLDGYGRSRLNRVSILGPPGRGEWLYRLNYPGTFSFNASINVFYHDCHSRQCSCVAVVIPAWIILLFYCHHLTL